METLVSSTREIIGNINFMKQLENIPVFPVEIFKLNDSGERELIRVEH